MKFLAAVIFTSMLAFGTAACAKEEPTKPAVAAPAAAPTDAPATKKACIKTTDPKTKKEVEKCKTVTIHKKHEGTSVDGAKKDSVKK